MNRCESCDAAFTGPPVTDETEVAWMLGRTNGYRIWCSTDCHTDASEAYWTGVWAA